MGQTNHMKDVVALVDSEEAHEHVSGSAAFSSTGLTTEDDLLDHSTSCASFSGFWDCQDEARSKTGYDCKTFVNTWYVNPLTLPIGVRSRKIDVTNIHSESKFLEACRNTWADVIVGEDLQWQEVQVPEGFGLSRQQIILSQESSADHQVALFRYAGFPILEQVRAMIFRRSDLAIDILRQLSVHRVCGNAGVKCLLSGFGNWQNIQFETWHQVQLQIPILLEIKALIMEPDGSDDDHSDSDSAADSDELSTSAGTDFHDASSQASEVDDVTSLMEGVSPTLRFQPNIPDVPALWLELQGNGGAEAAEDIDMNEDVIVINFDDVQRDLRTAADTSEDDSVLVITFGLGLVSLGRRDFVMYGDDVGALTDRVNVVWSDHAAFGQLHVITVAPQPSMEVARPHVVFIVEVAYVQLDDPLRRAPILVQENGADDMVATPDTYAARVERNQCASSLLSSIGRDAQVIPVGAREVQVSMRGQILAQDRWRLIEDGDLCTVQFGAYPKHVAEAERHLSRAAPMFVDLRNIVEHYDLLRIEICCHGISPQNRPLGMRSLWVTYGQMLHNSWFSEAKSLWPFAVDVAGLIFVARDEVVMLDDESATCTFHFMVNYRAKMEELPILFRQTILAHNDGTSHTESWACNVRFDIPPALLTHHLTHRFFWTRLPRRPAVRRHIGSDILKEGELIDLEFHTHTKANILATLAEYVTHEDDLEEEQISHQHFGHTSDDVDDNSMSLLQVAVFRKQQVQAFKEACDAILSRNDDSQECNTSEPEGNSDLRRKMFADVSDNLTDQDRTHASIPTLGHHVETCDEISSLQRAIDLLTNEDWKGINIDFEQIEELHPMAQKALEIIPLTSDHHGTFHIFTDGTAKDGTAAWSFVVIAKGTMNTDGPSFVLATRETFSSEKTLENLKRPLWMQRPRP